jgi:hypothetical protein
MFVVLLGFLQMEEMVVKFNWTKFYGTDCIMKKVVYEEENYYKSFVG